MSGTKVDEDMVQEELEKFQEPGSSSSDESSGSSSNEESSNSSKSKEDF